MRQQGVPKLKIVYRAQMRCDTPWGSYLLVIHCWNGQEVATFARRWQNGIMTLCAGLPAAFATFPQRVTDLEHGLGIPIVCATSSQFIACLEPPRCLS